MLDGELAQFSRWPRSILDSVSVGIAMIDLDGTVLFANRECLRIFGRSEAEMRRGLLNLVDLTHPEDREASTLAYQRLVSGEIDQHRADIRFLRPDDTLAFGHVAISAVRNEDANVRGCCLAIEDITGHKPLMDQQLAAAETVGRLATWRLDIDTGLTSASARYNALFGMSPAAPAPTLTELLERVHPDDRIAVSSAVGEAIASRSGYTQDYRIKLADGTTRWLRETTVFVEAPSGVGGHLVGATVDITDAKVRWRAA